MELVFPRPIISFIFALLCLFGNKAEAAKNRTKETTDEQRLYTYLLQNYDSNTRPVFNAAQPVNVTIGITLTQIFDVDERNQVIATSIWLDQGWRDEKLIWDPEEYNGLKVFRMPCASIWRPDIVLYNSADDYNSGYMQALAMVHSDGRVFWPPIVKYRSTCNIDITYFPFDDQICKLKLGSWAYDGFQVELFPKENPIDLTNFVSNGEWELIKVWSIRNQITYPCCPEHFPDVTFYIHIRRRTLYYTYNIIIPCIMLSMLTLAGFWMRPDSGEKVTLGLTVLLAFSVFMLLIAENMPATSSFMPLIGIYLTTVMSMTSLSVILAVLTSNINHRGRNQLPVPRVLSYVLTFLGKIMCMEVLFIRPKQRNSDNLNSQSKSRTDHRLHRYRGDRQYQFMSNTDSGCLIDYENGTSNSQSRTVCSRDTQIVHQPGSRENDDTNKDLTVILEKLDALIEKEDEREEEEFSIKQWVEVAEITDRFFFWMFVFGTGFASLFILVIYPFYKNVETIGDPL
ncbi:neuronal acetylcholine receptor subunit alpha-10-like [Dreissena polymorpha]|uniref:neuronal acetylcholine receptor subunit alpha-10-like n=1 Tax=Dreissena polymorpha TaxID=45954 RepID=UPI002264B535|nr:neuronal acetylcholine receptor subunit alpha-10-like [Dreissena polymorpha]